MQHIQGCMIMSNFLCSAEIERFKPIVKWKNKKGTYKTRDILSQDEIDSFLNFHTVFVPFH